MKCRFFFSAAGGLRPRKRVCFGKDGNDAVLLLAGGTKQRQQAEITAAQARWKDYKQCKTKGR